MIQSADRMMILADRPTKKADRTINLADKRNFGGKSKPQST
ncbi:hypothetical protein [Neobacillus sp. FSL H8-0543]